jgi:excisionase family DNA binding protein
MDGQLKQRLVTMSKTKANRQSVERAAWSVAEWASAVGCCRQTVYNLVKAGELQLLKMGRKSIVRPGPDDYLDRKAATGAQ